MGAVEGVQFSLKILANKEKNKVLFAEVDGEFADILVSFLTLPLGTIVRILEKHYGEEAPCIGSLNTLYGSLKDLDVSSFWKESGKLMLLNPKNPFEAHLQRLKMNIDATQPTKYFICDDWECTTRSDRPVNVSIRSTDKCVCGKLMKKELKLKSSGSDDVGTGVFTAKTASFVITDDLHIMPNSLGSGLSILKNLGIYEPHCFPCREQFVGVKEVIDLLKLALFSRTPLS